MGGGPRVEVVAARKRSGFLLSSSLSQSGNESATTAAVATTPVAPAGLYPLTAASPAEVSHQHGCRATKIVVVCDVEDMIQNGYHDGQM